MDITNIFAVVNFLEKLSLDIKKLDRKKVPKLPCHPTIGVTCSKDGVSWQYLEHLEFFNLFGIVLLNQPRRIGLY